MSKEARVKEVIKKAFNDPSIKKDADNLIKFHVKELDDHGIHWLWDLSVNKACEVVVKRSGTGLTVLVFL